MTKSIMKQWLSEDASVVAGLEEFTDGEQKLDVHVASEPSVDHELAEMAEAEIKHGEVERDCEALVEAQSAMESYLDLLEHGMENGGISDQAAAFMRVGLERYEHLFGLDDPLTPSVEAFGGSASQLHSTTISVESLSENLKKAWETIKKALQALFNALKDVYTRAVGTAARLEKRAGELKVKAGQLRGNTPNQDKVTISGASKLCADGVWKGDDVAVVSGFLAFALDRYPEGVLKYASDVASMVRGYEPGKEDAVSALSKMLTLDTVTKNFDGSIVTGDRRFSSAAHVQRTEILPGNMAMYLANPGTKDNNAYDQLKALNANLRSDMLPVSDAKVGEKSVEITVATPDRLAQRADQIAKAAAQIKRASDKQRSVKRAIDDLIKAGDDLKARTEKAEELSADQKKTVDAILRGLVAVQRLLGGTINGAVSYGVRTLNAQLAVVERQLAAYGSNRKDVVPA